MLARKCDVCAKLYEQYSGAGEYKGKGCANGLMLNDVDKDEKYWKRKKYDLCKECMEKLKTFLECNHE